MLLTEHLSTESFKIAFVHCNDIGQDSTFTKILILLSVIEVVLVEGKNNFPTLVLEVNQMCQDPQTDVYSSVFYGDNRHRMYRKM